MTPSATKVRGGPTVMWTRDKIIAALRRYADLYGPDFTAAAFSPSTAKWRDEPAETTERYWLGDPATGERWPSLNVIKKPFGGFNAAREAAGLPANKPGPAKRRKAGLHAPVRDVRHITRTVVEYRDGGEAVDAAVARAERAEAQLARALAKPKVTTKTKTKVVRERVVDGRAVARAEARAEKAEAKAREAVAAAKAEVAAARVDEAEAKAHATRYAARAERSEATVTTARAERREARDEAETLTREVAALADRLTAAVRERDEALAREPEVIREAAPEKAIVDEARRRAREAEVRAARAERELFDHVAAITGKRRKLTRAELAEYRASGPAGEALVLAAVKAVVKAKGRNRTALDAALYDLASAAVTWRERL